jgi:hypothetical protein
MKAFPCGEGIKPYEYGMDLRDYFAAKAMQAIITRADDRSAQVDEAVLWVGYYSYQIADAMMKARESK